MLTPDAYDEVFDLVVEECGEVVVARSKHRRFGPHSVDPRHPDGPDNHQALISELLDVWALVDRMIERRVLITPGEAGRHAAKKIASVKAHHPHLSNLL